MEVMLFNRSLNHPQLNNLKFLSILHAQLQLHRTRPNTTLDWGLKTSKASAMSSSTPTDKPSTPLTVPDRPTHNYRFTSQNETLEDVLKLQTVGLVHLSDFKKRRAELLEQKE